MKTKNKRIRKSQGLYYIEVQFDVIDRSSFWNIIRGKTIKRWTRASIEGTAVLYGIRDKAGAPFTQPCEPFGTPLQAEHRNMARRTPCLALI